MFDRYHTYLLSEVYFQMSTEEGVRNMIMGDFLVRFSSVAMNNMTIEYPSDEERRRRLKDEGYTVGRGSAQGCNCLADSLLQVLMHHKMVRKPLKTASERLWQHEVCVAARKHLCEHSNPSLRLGTFVSDPGEVSGRCPDHICKRKVCLYVCL